MSVKWMKRIFVIVIFLLSMLSCYVKFVTTTDLEISSNKNIDSLDTIELNEEIPDSLIHFE